MGSVSIPQINYAEFGRHLLERLGERRIPASGSWEMTFRCNLNCVHCYVNLPAGDKEEAEKELSYQEVCRILDEIVEEGCLWLLFTGGEPLVRPDFLDTYLYAKRKGLLITLFTNGTLLTKDIADLLVEYTPHMVEITLYGITSQTYEAITGVPGSFERCMRGIQLLRERQIPLRLKTMAMTLNKREVWDMKRYAENLGLEFRFDPIVNPRIDGSLKPCELRLSPEEVLQLDLADEKRAQNYKEFCEKFWGAASTDQLYGCGAGTSAFQIDPYGQMGMCLVARWPSYDLRCGSFHKGFYEFFPEVRSQKPRSAYKCGSCEIHNLCATCPGLAHMETGDQESVVDYYCQVAHIRAETFGRKGQLLETG